MKTVLLASELGTGLGPASVLAALARSLREDETRIVIATANLQRAHEAIGDVAGLSVLQAPAWSRHRHFGSDEGQANYLDLLVTIGFADAEKVAAVVAGWDALLDLVKPDVVVALNSPGLLLARLARQIPTVAIGSGSDMPPLDYDRFPPVLADRGPVLSEGRVIQIVADVLAGRGVASANSLPDWFRTEDRVVFSIPELDPYRSFRREPHHAPPLPLPEFADPPVEPRLLVFAERDSPWLTPTVQTLAQMELGIVAWFGGNPGPLTRFLALRGHTVCEKPPLLAELLPGVSHVLSTGSNAITESAFAAGRSQLIVPVDEEGKTNLRLLTGLAVAAEFKPSNEPDSIRGDIERFIGDHTASRNARGWANIVGGREQPDGTEAVVTAIRRHLA